MRVTTPKILSDAGIYGLGTIGQRALGILMLPIYTRYLSPGDYGIVSLLVVATELVSLFFSFQLIQSLFRFYFRVDDERQRKRIVSTTVVAALALKALAATTVWLLDAELAAVFLSDASLNLFLALFGITVFTNALTELPIQYLRALDRPKAFVAVSLLRLLAQLTLNIIFVVVLSKGVLGVIYSSLLSGLLVGVPMMAWTLRRTGLGFDLGYFRQIAVYSWPLILTGFIGLYMGSAPRVYLSHSVGLHEVGLFALALQLASAIDVFFAAPFNQSMGPLRFQIVRQSDGRELFRRAFGILAFGLAASLLGAAIFAEEFVEIMAGPAFWPAATLVAPLSLAVVLTAMEPFLRTGLLVAGRTLMVTQATLLGAVVLTAVLLIWAGLDPLVGAAFAVPIARAFVVWWTAARARREYDAGLKWGRFWLAFGLAGGGYALSLLAPEPLVAAISVKLAIFATTLLLMFLLPILDNRDRKLVYDFLIRRIRCGRKKHA